MINVSGHRLGTAEVEGLVLHKNMSEAAVVGYPHDIKGQNLCICYTDDWRKLYR